MKSVMVILMLMAVMRGMTAKEREMDINDEMKRGKMRLKIFFSLK